MKTVRIFNWAAAATLLALGAVILAGCQREDANRPSGTLEATEVDLATTLAGRITSVRADLGDEVKQGDTLLVLDTELIVLQRAQAAATRQTIAAQTLAARAQLAQADANLALIRTTSSRTEAMLRQGSATQQQLDEMEAKQEVAEQQRAAAGHQLDALAAENERLDASLAVFNRQLKDGVLTAPIDGVVIMRSAEPGEVATPGAVALRLADLSNLELRIFLGEKDVDRARLGQTLPVFVDALEKETLNGTVIWVSSEAEFTPKNAQTRQARQQLVYAVKLRVANPQRRLHIGMAAEVGP